jgi:ankyrin repeat protein
MSVSRVEEINYMSSGSRINSTSTIVHSKAQETANSTRATLRRLRSEMVALHAAQAIPEELLNAYIKYGNNADGLPALHAAIKARDERAMRLFLDHGADPNACTVPQIGFDRYPVPRTALEFAATFANSGIVNLLIDRGANVNPERSMTSPLQCAAKSNNLEVIRILVQRGADLKKEQSDHYGALMVAASEGHSEAVTTLIQLGMNPNGPNSFGQTPLDGALRAYVQYTREESFAGIETLLTKGASPNVKSYGYTALHTVAGFADSLNSEPKLLKITELLLKHGVDVNALNDQGKTALGILAQQRRPGFSYPALEKLLKEHGAVERK